MKQVRSSCSGHAPSLPYLDNSSIPQRAGRGDDATCLSMVCGLVLTQPVGVLGEVEPARQTEESGETFWI